VLALRASPAGNCRWSWSEGLRDILHVANRQINVEGIQKTVAEYFKIKVSTCTQAPQPQHRAAPAGGDGLAKDLPR
jgi:hypothetical protein